MNTNVLTLAEAELLGEVYALGCPKTVKEIRESIGTERAYTTIKTILDTLAEKGFLLRRASDSKSSSFLYEPTRPKLEVIRDQVAVYAFLLQEDIVTMRKGEQIIGYGIGALGKGE